MGKDYYRLLNISEKATTDEIKKAYRTMAKRYHPDKETGSKKKEAEGKFKEIAEAYHVLGNEKRRALYDRNRQAIGPFFEEAAFTGYGNGPGDGHYRKGCMGMRCGRRRMSRCFTSTYAGNQWKSIVDIIVEYLEK